MAQNFCIIYYKERKRLNNNATTLNTDLKFLPINHNTEKGAVVHVRFFGNKVEKSQLYFAN